MTVYKILNYKGFGDILIFYHKYKDEKSTR